MIIPEGSKLPPGLVSVFLTFKVDTEGKVTDINAQAQDQYLITEAIRVAKLIPNLKPDHIRGAAVTVPYTLPLKINLESKEREVSTYPVYRGCKNEITYKDTKKCTTERIVNYIKVSFDYVMADHVYPIAASTKFQVGFIIKKKGSLNK